MLSSVLSSARAVAVNNEIMRTFVRVREMAATHAGNLAWNLRLSAKKPMTFAIWTNGSGRRRVRTFVVDENSSPKGVLQS